MNILRAARIIFTVFFSLFLLMPVISAEASSAGNLNIIIKDEKHDFQPSPFIQEGRTMVPMRSFFDTIGAEVQWIHEERTAKAQLDEIKVIIPAQSTQPKVNGEEVDIDTPAVIIKGRMFIPARFAAECLGYEVNWDSEQKAVIINAGEETNLSFSDLETTYPDLNEEKNNDKEAGNEEEVLEKEKAEEIDDAESSSNNNTETAIKDKKDECPGETGNFIWPVDGGQVVSEYGMRGGRMHYGLDIGAKEGTSIFASKSGEVVYEGWESDGYGYSVVIKHGNYYTRYAHNSENLVGTGEYVSQGQVIAKIGQTGNANCPHVHFEVRTGGMYGDNHHDPLEFIGQE